MNRFMRTITHYTLLLSVIGITGWDQSSLQAAARYPAKAGRIKGHTEVDPTLTMKLKELAKQHETKKKALLPHADPCCNLTEFSGCVPTTEPFTEIRQKDIPMWITCPGKYKIMEDLFYDGDTDANNPNPAAALYGPIGIGINAPNVVLDMNGHTFTYQGFSTNAIMTYDTIDLNGNYFAQANNVTIKNGAIIGNLDPLSFGVVLLSSFGTISNVTSKFSDLGFAVDTFAFIINEQNEPVDVIAKLVVGTVIDKCFASLNTVGILTLDPPIQISIFNSIFDQNIAGMNLNSTVTIDSCAVSNSLSNGIVGDQGGQATNWNIRNTSIINSGRNGLIIVGGQNVLVSDTQINNSGADGIIVGIRAGKNVQLNRVQVFNANGILLRVDEVDSFKADDCQFINFLQNPLPNNSPANPVVRIEDSFNVLLSNTLMNSNSGTSDGCFIRNSQGVICDNCAINLTSTEAAPHPSGFVLQGSVSASSIKNSSINGLFAQGISLTRNKLNGINEGIVLENNTIEGAFEHGIFVSEATSCALLGNIIALNQGNGITLDETSSRSLVRDNIIMNNKDVGLSNKGSQNKICQNFLSWNGKEKNVKKNKTKK